MKEENPSLSLTLATAADAAKLEPAWTRLWEEIPQATLFVHPGWMRIWWNHFGGDKEWLLLCMRDDGGRLAGVIPLCLLRESGLRKVMFIGAGLSDCADALFAAPYQAATTAVFRAWLAESASRWDVCDLQPLPPGSPLLGSDASFPLRHTVAPAEPHTVLQLPPGIAEFQERQSRHFRERMGDALRAARKLGEVRFEQADGASLEPMLDALLRFRRMRWQGGGNAPEAFFRESARFLLELGVLRFFCLRIGGRIVAALYGFLHRNRAGLYLTGFDPAQAKASPGTLLLGHALEQFIREGAAECDFLRGREPFKYRWGVVERPYYAWRAWSGAAA